MKLQKYLELEVKPWENRPFTVSDKYPEQTLIILYKDGESAIVDSNDEWSVRKGEQSFAANLTNLTREDDLTDKEIAEYEEYLMPNEDLLVFQTANPNIERVWALPH